MVCAVRDVSEREERYEALERYRANLELAEERAGLGHWIWWTASGEVEWSEGLYRIAGRDPQSYEPTPRSLVEIAHPDDRETVEDPIERACSNLARRIEEEGARVTSSASQEVEADPNQVTQVLQNLIENGIKFNQSETPQVHVESEQVGERVVV